MPSDGSPRDRRRPYRGAPAQDVDEASSYVSNSGGSGPVGDGAEAAPASGEFVSPRRA